MRYALFTQFFVVIAKQCAIWYNSNIIYPGVMFVGADYISQVRFIDELDGNSYLQALPVVQYLKKAKALEFSAPVTFFVGENGTGKSTLLEAIAVAFGFNAEGGTKNFRFSTNETHSELCDSISLVKRAYANDGFFLRAESLYNAATYIDEVNATHNYGPVSLHHQSHGESFMAIVQNRFSGRGVYLLDEPEAALSPMRQLTLLAEMQRLTQMDSQFIIATHSPILMAFPGAEIMEFSSDGIRKTCYRETEHYQVTKRFLDDPERMLHYLLK